MPHNFRRGLRGAYARPERRPERPGLAPRGGWTGCGRQNDLPRRAALQIALVVGARQREPALLNQLHTTLRRAAADVLSRPFESVDGSAAPSAAMSAQSASSSWLRQPRHTGCSHLIARRPSRADAAAILTKPSSAQPRVFPHEKKDLGRDGPARSPGRQRPAVHAADCGESDQRPARPGRPKPRPLPRRPMSPAVRTRCSSAQPAPACTASRGTAWALDPRPPPTPSSPLLTYTRQFACIQVDNQFEAEGYSLGVERGCAVASDKKVLLSSLLVIVGTGTLRRSPPPLPYLLAQSLRHAAFSRPRRSDRPRTTLQHHLSASPPPRPAAPESAALKAKRRLHRTRRRFAARILRAATLMFCPDAA